MALRHFPYRHPTFGTAKAPKSPNHWKVSVYYWWYEYLKRNSEYKKTCERGGVGKCDDLYKLFGDVHAHDFKVWWSEGDRGAKLFANPPTPSITILNQPDDSPVLFKDDALLLQVPLGLPITHLVQSFRKLVTKHHSGKKGHTRVKLSTAQFVPKGKVDVGFLEIALLVWDERQANPKKPLWQIAQDVGIAGKHRVKPTDSPMESRDKRNVLTAMTSRYYKKANAMIASTAKGTFPH
jgi:hypothetical protein